MSTHSVNQASNVQYNRNIFGTGGSVVVDGTKYSYSGKITAENKAVLEKFVGCLNAGTFKGTMILDGIKFSSTPKGPFAKVTSFVKSLFETKMAGMSKPQPSVKTSSTAKTSSVNSEATIKDRFCKQEMEGLLKQFVKNCNEWDADTTAIAKETANKFAECLAKNEGSLGQESKAFLQDLKKLATGAGDGNADNLCLDRNSGSTAQLAQALSGQLGKTLGWE